MLERKKKTRTINILQTHLINNKKEYLIATIILFIGLLFGVIYINNVDDNQKQEISKYINDIVVSLKKNIDVDKLALLQDSITNNVLLTILLWFVGSTVIGIPIVYGILIFRGFCLGYTISALLATLGTGKGLIFALSSILLQNILFIPGILALVVSGTKLYKSIIKDKRKENIKVEILRHTIFSAIICLILIGSSFIEVYLSTTLIKMSINVI